MSRHTVVRTLVYVYFSFWAGWLISGIVLSLVLAAGGPPGIATVVWLIAAGGVMLGMVSANRADFGEPLAWRKWLILSVVATVLGVTGFMYVFSANFNVIGL
jgi:hypothetical protein